MNVSLDDRAFAKGAFGRAVQSVLVERRQLLDCQRLLPADTQRSQLAMNSINLVVELHLFHTGGTGQARSRRAAACSTASMSLSIEPSHFSTSLGVSSST